MVGHLIRSLLNSTPHVHKPAVSIIDRFDTAAWHLGARE